jgi:signal transduction histidine kinase
MGDKKRYEQFLLNFLSNSLKFTEENDLIQIMLKVLDRNRDSIRFQIMIEDTGKGISKEGKSKLF